jgi:hypothetical protein
MKGLLVKRKKTKFGDERDGPLGSRPTMPPVSRPGLTYPGGRSLRRSLTRLSRRQNSIPNKPGFTKPGSMKKG